MTRTHERLVDLVVFWYQIQMAVKGQFYAFFGSSIDSNERQRNDSKKEM